MVAAVMLAVVGVDPSRPFLRTQVEVTRGAFMGLPMGGALVFLPLFCKAIQPETGALAQLGAGTRQVSARQVRRLRRWQLALGVPGVGIGLWFLVGPGLWLAMMSAHSLGLMEMEDFPGDMRVIAEIFAPIWWCMGPMMIFGMMPSMLLGYPIAMQWYVSMKVVSTT